MGSIYETAEEILVWLSRGDGPNEENIIALMESITWINDRGYQCSNDREQRALD